MRVLLTRPEPEAAESARLLESGGYEVLRSPVLAIRPLDAAMPPGPFEAVLVTSANGARGLAAQGWGPDLRGLPMLTVGEATAAEARALGYSRARAVAEDAASFAGHLAASRATIRDERSVDELSIGLPLLYAAGRERRPLIEERLAAAGLPVAVVEVYAAERVTTLTDEARLALGSGAVDAVLHFSRRSAAAFLDAAKASGVLRPALGTAQVAISTAAAEPLGAAGASLIAVAIRPTLSGVIAALDTIRASRRQAQHGSGMQARPSRI